MDQSARPKSCELSLDSFKCNFLIQNLKILNITIPSCIFPTPRFSAISDSFCCQKPAIVFPVCTSVYTVQSAWNALLPSPRPQPQLWKCFSSFLGECCPLWNRLRAGTDYSFRHCLSLCCALALFCLPHRVVNCAWTLSLSVPAGPHCPSQQLGCHFTRTNGYINLWLVFRIP